MKKEDVIAIVIFLGFILGVYGFMRLMCYTILPDSYVTEVTYQNGDTETLTFKGWNVNLDGDDLKCHYKFNGGETIASGVRKYRIISKK